MADLECSEKSIGRRIRSYIRSCSSGASGGHTLGSAFSGKEGFGSVSCVMVGSAARLPKIHRKSTLGGDLLYFAATQRSVTFVRWICSDGYATNAVSSSGLKTHRTRSL